MRWGRVLVAILALPLLPLPWRAAPPSAGPGTAWRVDGRLEVGGEPVDPPGTVLWLAAGRPQLLGERALEVVGRRPPSSPILRGDPATSSVVAVPAAVAAALEAAGQQVGDANSARLVLRVGPVDIGRSADGLHLGDSHGLAIAVAVLRSAGAIDVGPGVVAATGRVGSGGVVLPVGGIAPKVRAAARAGARTVLVPGGQEEEARVALEGRPIAVRGVGHLTELLGPTARP